MHSHLVAAQGWHMATNDMRGPVAMFETHSTSLPIDKLTKTFALNTHIVFHILFMGPSRGCSVKNKQKYKAFAYIILYTLCMYLLYMYVL